QNTSSDDLIEKRGTSKGRGRVLKVLGDLNLLCGIVTGAITSYIQSIEILRLTTDYVWHASALEGIAMALVLLRYLKIDHSVFITIKRSCLLIHSRSQVYCNRRFHRYQTMRSL